MDTFRTTFPIPKFNIKITHASSILTVGSCFADNIGNKLNYYKYDVLQNPFGVLYNPASISKNLDAIIHNQSFSDEDLVFHDNLWHSWMHHSQFSNSAKEEVLHRIANTQEKTTRHLKKALHIFITYGTSWIYEYKKDKRIVANCHKLPSSEFSRRRMTLSEITERMGKTIEEIRAINPKVQIIQTVSPIRNWKDGAPQNQLSKALLIAASHQICEDHLNVHYFPAYELMVDDLRDYRFYASDMLHPSETAVNYIWTKFREVFIDPDMADTDISIEKLQKALTHRPVNKTNPQYKKFVLKQLRLIDYVIKNQPNINLRREHDHFTAELNT
jgi:hypothetical protein